jgi:hypothetical protein
MSHRLELSTGRESASLVVRCQVHNRARHFDAAIATILKTSQGRLRTLAAVSSGTQESCLVRVLLPSAADPRAQHLRPGGEGRRVSLARRSNRARAGSVRRGLSKEELC